MAFTKLQLISLCAIGDVKHRNVVRLGHGGHALIDLDASASIDKESAGKKLTSSGYW